MEIVTINFIAALIAAIASMIVGYIWYGPLFGKTWMALSGMDSKKMEQAKKGMMKGYLISFIGAFIMACVLAYVLAYSSSVGIADAIQGAFWMWLGFIATVQIGMVLWDNKPMKLFLIHTSHQLVSVIVMAIIIVTIG
ncbi:MAG: DUF1761 domain-containing protein [archaeon]|nr:DUF1761 domain-containing protein [archaeon]